MTGNPNTLEDLADHYLYATLACQVFSANRFDNSSTQPSLVVHNFKCAGYKKRFSMTYFQLNDI